MAKQMLSVLSGTCLDENSILSMTEICHAFNVEAEQIIELVEEGIVEPQGKDHEQWRFSGVSLRRIRIALQLQHDLDVNSAGAALALELLDEIELLRSRLKE